MSFNHADILKKTFNNIIQLLPLLLLLAMIIIVPNLSDTSLMSPTQDGKTFGFLWCIIGAVIVVSVLSFITKKTGRIILFQLDILLGIYAAVVFLQGVYFPIDILKIMTFGGLVLFYVLIRRIDLNYHKYLLLAIVIAGLIQAVYGNLQLYGVYHSHHRMFKMTGSFFNPGPYAGFLVSVLPIALIGYFSRNKDDEDLKGERVSWQALCSTIAKYFYGVTFIVIILVLPATKSRAAYLGAIISIVYAVYWLSDYEVINLKIKRFIGQRSNKLLLGILSVIVLLGCSWGLYSMKKGSADGRVLIWKVATQMIPEKPVFGHGIGQFKSQYMNYQASYFSANPDSPDIMVADNSSYSFNEFVKLTVEQGILGLLLVIAMLVLIFRKRRSNITKRGSDEVDGIMNKGNDLQLQNANLKFLAAKSGLLAVIVFGLFSYPSEILPIKMHFVVFLAMIVACQGGVKKKILTSSRTFSMLQRWVVTPVFVVLMVLSLGTVHRAYHTAVMWKDAYRLYQVGAYEESVEAYDKVYHQLNHNGEYLVNYGKALSMAGKHEKAIDVLKEAKDYLNNTILYTALGDSYQALKMYKDAEKAYWHAFNMVPSRFYPKYLLAKMYSENGHRKEACKLAKELLYKKVKVKSIAIDEIRDEMTKILDNDVEI
ncbi:hypothetical protein EYV94_11500 [Puteibacter caeruleilacunae]|nr:hypothetical protein EYV94_11500 [Puteibacter caeruleilacunae]